MQWLKIIKDKYGTEISDITIKRTLNELRYSYAKPQISPKIIGKNNKD